MTRRWMTILTVVAIVSAADGVLDRRVPRLAAAETVGDPAISATPKRDDAAGRDREHDPDAVKDSSQPAGHDRGSGAKNPSSGRAPFEPPTGSAKESGPGSGEGM